jgi:hypothetical protein
MEQGFTAKSHFPTAKVIKIKNDKTSKTIACFSEAIYTMNISNYGVEYHILIRE